MKLTYIGHAKALLEADRIRLITDPSFSEPLYCNTLWHYPPLRIGLEQLPPLDFIYVSHHHRDHFDPLSLSRLDKAAALIVPAFDDGWGPMNSTGERDRFHGIIRRLGFRKVHVLHAWETLAITPNVRVTMVPAATLEPDSSLVVQADGQTVFVQNDNYLGNAVRDELARRFPAIDVGLMFWGVSAGYPANADLRPETKVQEAQRRRNEYYLPMVRDNLAALRPRLFVPFANDLSWLAPSEVWINRLCRMHPGHLRAYLDANPVPGVALMQMNSGDSWTPADGLRRASAVPDWRFFFDELERYAAGLSAQIEAILEHESAIDTNGLPELWRQRMAEVGVATPHIIKLVGELTVYFRVVGTAPCDFSLTFADGRLTLGGAQPAHWDLRITIDDFLLVRALLGQMEFQEIRNTRWHVSHPNGYTDAIRRFWMWLFVHVDNYIADHPLSSELSEVVTQPMRPGCQEHDAAQRHPPCPRRAPATGGFA